MPNKSELQGGEALLGDLRALEKRVAGKYVRAALRAGAKVVQAQCKADAPAKSGLTRRSLKVRAGRRSRTGVTMLVTIGKGAYKGDSFYAAFQNYGWRSGRRNRIGRATNARFKKLWREFKGSGKAHSDRELRKVQRDLVYKSAALEIKGEGVTNYRRPVTPKAYHWLNRAFDDSKAAALAKITEVLAEKIASGEKGSGDDVE